MDELVNVGDVVAGRYRVDRVIGKGAMGLVVAATHVELHQTRAIKFMLPETMHDKESVERFLREARAAARLESHHAVKVHDVARLPTGEPYIVMEYLEGVDLKQYLAKRRLLPVPEAASFMLQACEAIAEAHAAGIVHRDLKPANMFLAERAGGAPVLKVLDFGIAKVNDPQGSGADGQLTATHTVIGSPLYMSPEQILSTRNVDARSDVWSLGVILYTLLTGAIPFRGDSTHAIFASVQRDDPMPPSQWSPNIPEDLERLILRCLEKDPARRIQSAAELAAGLMPFAPDAARRSFPRAIQSGSETAVATQVYRPSSPQVGVSSSSSSSRSGAGGASGSRSSSQPGSQSYPQPGSQSYSQPGSQSYSQPGQHGGHTAVMGASASQPQPQPQPQPQAQPGYLQAAGPSGYMERGAATYPQGGGPQGYPQPGSQGYLQPGSQGYPQPGSQSNSFPGSQSNSFSRSQSNSFPGSQSNSFSGSQGSSFPGSQGSSFPGSQSSSFPGSQSNSFPGSQSSSFSGSQSNSFPGSQSNPPGAPAAFPQTGAQTNSPITHPIDSAPQKRGSREALLVGGGFATALLIVAAFVIFSRSGGNSQEKPSGAQATTAAPVTQPPDPGSSGVPAVTPVPVPSPGEAPSASADSAQGGPSPDKAGGGGAAKASAPGNAGGFEPTKPKGTSPAAPPNAPSAKPTATAPAPSTTTGAPLRKRND